jgi:tRNA uridine 5-carbamoylmethylation protein Kti12
MQDTIVLEKNADIVSRVIDDETILMPIYKTSDEANYIYSLNKVAARIWELIDGKRNLAKIKKILLEEFDTTEKALNKELDKFLKELKEIKAFKR